MFARTNIPEAPWYIVEGNDKKRARLNCIDHLLGLIPYEDVPHEEITLPDRVFNPDYERADAAARALRAAEVLRCARCARLDGGMLSYQHMYHAGNLADVHKHALLALTLDYMVQKDKPLSYIESHAGRGLYRLDSDEALKTGEAAQGVAPAGRAVFPADHPYCPASGRGAGALRRCGLSGFAPDRGPEPARD